MRHVGRYAPNITMCRLKDGLFIHVVTNFHSLFSAVYWDKWLRGLLQSDSECKSSMCQIIYMCLAWRHKIYCHENKNNNKIK